MTSKEEPVITDYKGKNWIKVSFKPELEMFKMSSLEDDVVTLMKKQVVDIAACLGESVNIKFNDNSIKFGSFKQYIDLYVDFSQKSTSIELLRYALLSLVLRIIKIFDFLITLTALLYIIRIYDKIGNWEIYISMSEGQFQQVIR